MNLRLQAPETTAATCQETNLRIAVFMAKYGEILAAIKLFDLSDIELALLSEMPLEQISKLRETIAAH